MKKKILEVLEEIQVWKAPKIYKEIPCGDMPGDKVKIGEYHISKAEVIFKELLKIIPKVVEKEQEKIVISVCGGSGVGKSGIASVLTYYFNTLGIGCYTLSGDNYPRRIPKYNDAERYRIYSTSGIRALVNAELMNKENYAILRELQEKERDADKKYCQIYPWFSVYLEGGIKGLKQYLGTRNEIDFDELSKIIKLFKEGEEQIYLKRMGRIQTEVWYEKIDFSQIDIMIIEWTHGNSDYYEGVDIPILLNSTPEETLEYRKIRNRDDKIDSSFMARVLECEQELLDEQAHKAKIILSKKGEILTYAQYQELMR